MLGGDLLYGGHSFILPFITIIIFSTTLIINLTFSQKVYVYLVTIIISLLVIILMKFNNYENVKNIYNLIGVLAILIFLNNLFKNNLKIRKLFSLISYCLIVYMIVLSSFLWYIVQINNPILKFDKTKILSQLSKEIKDITQYDDKYRIWILDEKKDFIFSGNNNNILIDTMYSDYSRFYKPYDICGQISWFKLFGNSIIYARGFSSSKDAKEKIFKIVQNCELDKKNIEEINLKFNNAYSFKLNFNN